MDSFVILSPFNAVSVLLFFSLFFVMLPVVSWETLKLILFFRTCVVGDMIYQGQKALKKRWKKFPTPLPLLLLHGTDDPICSYQATHTLSSQILKRQPLNFIFKSWKGNMHDRRFSPLFFFVHFATRLHHSINTTSTIL